MTRWELPLSWKFQHSHGTSVVCFMSTDIAVSASGWPPTNLLVFPLLLVVSQLSSAGNLNGIKDLLLFWTITSCDWLFDRYALRSSLNTFYCFAICWQVWGIWAVKNAGTKLLVICGEQTTLKSDHYRFFNWNKIIQSLQISFETLEIDAWTQNAGRGHTNSPLDLATN